METNHISDMEKDLQESAKKRIKEIKNFYIHLIVFVIATSLFLLKTYFGMPFNFWPISELNCLIISIWSSALIIQALDVFVSEVIFGKKWENRKVRRMLEKKKEKQNWE